MNEIKGGFTIWRWFQRSVASVRMMLHGVSSNWTPALCRHATLKCFLLWLSQCSEMLAVLASYCKPALTVLVYINLLYLWNFMIMITWSTDYFKPITINRGFQGNMSVAPLLKCSVYKNIYKSNHQLLCTSLNDNVHLWMQAYFSW